MSQIQCSSLLDGPSGLRVVLVMTVVMQIDDDEWTPYARMKSRMCLDVLFLTGEQWPKGYKYNTDRVLIRDKLRDDRGAKPGAVLQNGLLAFLCKVGKR